MLVKVFVSWNAILIEEAWGMQHAAVDIIPALLAKLARSKMETNSRTLLFETCRLFFAMLRGRYDQYPMLRLYHHDRALT